MEVRNWRDFEIFTAGFFGDIVPAAIITHDSRVKDEHGIRHQIDVDIEIPHTGQPVKIMLDTKLRLRNGTKGPAFRRWYRSA